MNADGYVALEHHAAAAGMVVGSRHLAVQDVLDIIVIGHLVILRTAGIAQCGAVGLVPGGVALPLGKVGSAVRVAQVAVLGVGH